MRGSVLLSVCERPGRRLGFPMWPVARQNDIAGACGLLPGFCVIFVTRKSEKSHPEAALRLAFRTVVFHLLSPKALTRPVCRSVPVRIPVRP